MPGIWWTSPISGCGANVVETAQNVGSSNAGPEVRIRPSSAVEFAVDSPLEGRGFELVWGFSCQAVVLGCADSFLFGAAKAVFRSLIAPQVAREFFPLEAVSSPWPVDRRAKRIPL